MRQDRKPCISGWLKNSFIDFPGTVSTVLFFHGCNLRCGYCHNAPIVIGEPTPIDHKEIFDFLARRKGIIEGVVLTGGEPTLYGDALVDFAGRIRETEMKLKLDTNGLLPEHIPRVKPDYLAMDLKTIPARYKELGWKGGDPTEKLEKSLAIVKSMQQNAEIRITAATPYIDDTAIETMLPLLDGVSKVYLQPYSSKGPCLDPEHVSAVNREKLAKYRDRIAEVVEMCVVRGIE